MNFKVFPFYFLILFSIQLKADVSGSFVVSTDFLKTVCDVSISGGTGAGGQVIDGTGTTTPGVAVIDLGMFSINNDFTNSNTTELQDVVLSFSNCPDTDVNFTLFGTQTSEDDTIFVMEGDNAAILGLVIQYGKTMLQNISAQEFNIVSTSETGTGTATLNVGYKIFGATTSFVQETNATTLVTLNMIYGS